jgi:hypothetical protein
MVVGTILCAVALGRYQDAFDQKNKGLAVAGLVIGIVVLAILLLVLILLTGGGFSAFCCSFQIFRANKKPLLLQERFFLTREHTAAVTCYQLLSRKPTL